MKKFMTCFLFLLFALCLTAQADWTANAGNRFTVTASDGNTYEYYVAPDGNTSAVVQDADYTWLYVRYIDGFSEDGMPHYGTRWFGLSNFEEANGTRPFRPGSRFSIRFLEEASREYQKLYNLIDSQERENLKDGDLLFVLEITDEDGNVYHALQEECQLLISGNSRIIALDTGVDDTVPILHKTDIPAPETGSYTCCILHHVDRAFALQTEDASLLGSMIDGHPSVLTLALTGVIVIALVAVSVIVIKKKKREAER